MKFALVPQVDQDLQLWADPKDRLLPHNCAPPKANKVPRVSQWDWIAVYLLSLGMLIACVCSRPSSLQHFGLRRVSGLTERGQIASVADLADIARYAPERLRSLALATVLIVALVGLLYVWLRN